MSWKITCSGKIYYLCVPNIILLCHIKGVLISPNYVMHSRTTDVTQVSVLHPVTQVIEKELHRLRPNCKFSERFLIYKLSSDVRLNMHYGLHGH